MNSIHSLAQQGTLTEAQLNDYRLHQPELIDSLSNGLTPLIAAVLRSRLQTITLLHQYGANVDAVDGNGRTALSVAAEKVWLNQAAVVQALLSATPKPDVDATCPSVHHNTPLMLVIQQSRNLAVIRQLLDAGASLTAVNAPRSLETAKKKSQKKGGNALQLAKATKDPQVIHALQMNVGLGVGPAEVVTKVMDVVTFILELLNKPLLTGVRFLHKWYGRWSPRVPDHVRQEITGSGSASSNPKQKNHDDTPLPQMDDDSRDNISSGTVPNLSSDHTQCPESDQGNDDGQGVPAESTPNLSPEELAEQTIRKKLEDIMQYVKRTRLNEYFTLEDDHFLQTIIEKAMKLRQDKSTSLGNSENLPQMIELAMFKPVVYCDDSGSMRTKEEGSDSTRHDRLISIVQRVARITTKLVPDEMGVDLRFINRKPKESLDNLQQKDLVKEMEKIRPVGGTHLGYGLETKVLRPMIYNVLEQKEKKLQRPILVTIITDGCPDDDDKRDMQTVIKKCRNMLEDRGYPDYAAIFQISQVGSDPDATEFLNKLINDNETKDFLYCTTDRLDKKYEELRDNESDLEIWLLKHLMRPILRWGKDFVNFEEEATS